MFLMAGGWMIPTLSSSALLFVLFDLFFQLSITNFMYQGQICLCEENFVKAIGDPLMGVGE